MHRDTHTQSHQEGCYIAALCMVSWYECAALCAAAHRLLQKPCRSGMQPGQEVITRKGKSQKEKADHSCSSVVLTAVTWAGLCAPARSIAAAADQNLIFTQSPVVPQVRCISAQNLMASLSLVKTPRHWNVHHTPTLLQTQTARSTLLCESWKVPFEKQNLLGKWLDQAEQKEN